MQYLDENDPTLGTMLQELQTLNKIAVLKEEDNVVKNILRGKSRKNILEELQQKYPEEQITKRDLDDFIVLYRDVLYSAKTDMEKAYTRRLLKSKEGLTNELLDLARQAKNMVEKYDEEKDNTNAVGALRAASDIFMKFAKVEGLAQDKPEVNVNMQMDKVVQEATTADSNFKRSVETVLNNNNDEEDTEEGEIVDE